MASDVKTKTEVVTETLERMGATAIGATPATADSTDLGNAYDEVYFELEADGLTTWAFDASVPQKYVDILSDMMGIRRASKYGVPEEKLRMMIANVGADGERGKGKIRRFTAHKVTQEIAAGNYY